MKKLLDLGAGLGTSPGSAAPGLDGSLSIDLYINQQQWPPICVWRGRGGLSDAGSWVDIAAFPTDPSDLFNGAPMWDKFQLVGAKGTIAVQFDGTLFSSPDGLVFWFQGSWSSSACTGAYEGRSFQGDGSGVIHFGAKWGIGAAWLRGHSKEDPKRPEPLFRAATKNPVGPDVVDAGGRG